MSKAKRNHRDCPAAGQPITSQECGAGRMSRWTCPAECPFNPWSPENYDEMLEIDTRLTGKMMDRFGAEQRKGIVGTHELNPVPSIHMESMWVRRFFVERDAAGRTFIERWEAERFRDLNNDERVLLGFMAKTKPTLLEIQQVRMDGELDGVDLLDAARTRFVARDYSLSKRALRFSVFFMWVVKLPFYARFHGGGIEMPEVHDHDPEEVLREVASHLGAPADPAANAQWLAENFGRVCEAAIAVSMAMQRRTFEGIDGKFFKTTYRVMGSDKVLFDRLDRRDDVVLDDLSEDELAEGFEESFTWLEGQQTPDAQQGEFPIFPTAPIAGVPFLGRVLLGPKQARIEASSAARNVPLRARFEKMAGTQVEFATERVDDLARQVIGNLPAFDPALVPPSLLACAPKIELQSSIAAPDESARDSETHRTDLLRRHHERWLDDSIPALDGRTPRAAANDPALRPRLIRMMKTMIRNADRENLQRGTDSDLNWMLETLGLHEIIVEPPPHREVPTDFEDENEDEDEDYFSPEEIAEAARPDPPVRVLDETEVERRLDAQVAQFSSDEAMLKAFFGEAGDFIHLVADFTGDWLDENAQATLLGSLIGGYFLLFPPGTDRPIVNGLRLERRFEAQLQEIWSLLAQKTKHTAAVLPAWIQDCRQPSVALFCSNLVMRAADEGPRKHRIPPEEVPVMLAFIKAAVDEFDCVRA